MSISDNAGLFVCVRVPKSGSSSLSRLLASVFAGRRTFLLPNTLNLDGRLSGFQRLRFRRTRLRNTRKLDGTFDTEKAYALINAESKPGDLIDGGHLISERSMRRSSTRSRSSHPAQPL